MTASGDQVCFLFIVKIEIIKIRPLTTFTPTHGPPTQRLTESLIISERLGNTNIFILHNTRTAGKTYNYTSVYYPKRIGFHKAHTEESTIFIF